MLPGPLGKLLPGLSLDGSRNVLRDAWNLLAGLPGGKVLFSRLVGRLAPYTGTIGARVVTLRPGFCQVELDDRRGVRNHLASIHAVALVNLAELAGNAALAYSLPDDARFIVAGLSIDYVKKARGTITATSECPVPATSERVEYQVPVVMTDAGGEVVARATLRSLVGPKARAGQGKAPVVGRRIPVQHLN
ncbi:MAG TPA: hotdog fold domain-containing protein [Kofleriaceae bacterium]|jgi:acyl-coenzyme A thioesterase PaaI-like protein|nr:hotdog fold domain-containing protein [Kofleriaceae bacterium]